jgi:hypothetical protein
MLVVNLFIHEGKSKCLRFDNAAGKIVTCQWLDTGFGMIIGFTGRL